MLGRANSFLAILAGVMIGGFLLVAGFLGVVAYGTYTATEERKQRPAAEYFSVGYVGANAELNIEYYLVRIRDKCWLSVYNRKDLDEYMYPVSKCP